MSAPDSDRLECEDLTLRSTDEGPVLDIGGGISLLLRAFVDIQDGDSFDSAAKTVQTEIDSGGDDGAWWTIWHGGGPSSNVTILPEVVDQEGSDA